MEDHLIQNCIAGDRLSQIEFYDRFSHSIYNTCYRIIRDMSKAEEVTHESFIKIFGRLDHYQEEPEMLVHALRRIAINGAIDSLRKKKMLFIEIDDRMPIANEEESCDDSDKLLTVDKIKKAMDHLPQGYKLVVTLKLIEGLEYDDIAQELGIAVSTVRSQYKRGIAKLKLML